MTRTEQKALAGDMMAEITSITGRCPYSSTGKTIIADTNDALRRVLNKRGVRFASLGSPDNCFLVNVNKSNSKALLG